TEDSAREIYFRRGVEAGTAAPDHYGICGSILQQHGARVLPVGLRQLPREGTAHGVSQSRHLGRIPIHGGGARRSLRRSGFRSAAEKNRLRQYWTQGAYRGWLTDGFVVSSRGI